MKRLACFLMVFGMPFAPAVACGLYAGGISADAGSDDDGRDVLIRDDQPQPDVVVADVGMDAAQDVVFTCPPNMISTGSFCIDKTEVTNDSYAKLIDTLDGSVPDVNVPATCTWNTTMVPSSAWPNEAGALPVTYVDWCDAALYCLAQGKRLCGKPGGGTADYSETMATGSEWIFACQGGVGRPYPYGNSYVSGTCNDVAADAGTPAPVGSLGGCAGGFPGLLDMSGNVAEWENACTNGGNPAKNGCRFRGGSYSTVQAGCASSGAADRDQSYAHVGFRCCAP